MYSFFKFSTFHINAVSLVIKLKVHDSEPSSVPIATAATTIDAALDTTDEAMKAGFVERLLIDY